MQRRPPSERETSGKRHNAERNDADRSNAERDWRHARLRGAVAEAQSIDKLCGRLDSGTRACDSAADVLDPISSFLGAETAAIRVLTTSDANEIPRPIATLEIPSSVGDAYLERFHTLDPIKRLPRHGLAEPVFTNPDRPGEWLDVQMPRTILHQHRQEFAAYHRDFLKPNNLFQHVGFCFHDRSGRMLLFDFHRGCHSAPFGRLETARARIVGRYLHGLAARGWTPAAPSSLTIRESSLSAREFEVATAVARGLTNKEVAAALAISVRTVENHMRSIFAKLGVASRTQLTAALHRRL